MDSAETKVDECESTTPPIPPADTSETLQQPHPEPSQPPSAQKEVMDTDIDETDLENQTEQAPQSKLPRPARGKTPEPSRVIQISHHTNGKSNGHGHAAAVAHAPHLARERSETPGSPGSNLDLFDWDDLETRFEKALTDANQNEQAMLDEFESLIKYFNVWASTASAHDNERAAKRYSTPRCFTK